MANTNGASKRIFSCFNDVPSKTTNQPVMVDECTGTDSPLVKAEPESEQIKKRFLHKIHSNQKFVENKEQYALKSAIASSKVSSSQNKKHSTSMSLPVCNHINFTLDKPNNINMKKIQRPLKIFSYHCNLNSLENYLQYKPKSYSLSKDKKIKKRVNQTLTRNASQPFKYNANTFSIVNLPFTKPSVKENSERLSQFNGKYLKKTPLNIRKLINIKTRNINSIFNVSSLTKDKLPSIKNTSNKIYLNNYK